MTALFVILATVFAAGLTWQEWWLCIYAVVTFLLFALIDLYFERNDDDEYL